MTGEVQHNLVSQVRAALEHEPRVNLHRFRLAIDEDADGTVILEGEAHSIAAKKIALEVAASTPGVTGIVDRLHVAPARRMGDGEIRDHICASLAAEPALGNCSISGEADGRRITLRQLDGAADQIELAVQDGIATIDGRVNSVSHKLLAGALAWWVPGTRDVINTIEVVPPQELTDSDITDALRQVLEKDPLLNADAIRVIIRNRVAVLEGCVSSIADREMAEMDAWYMFGLDLVINRLQVQQ